MSCFLKYHIESFSNFYFYYIHSPKKKQMISKIIIIACVVKSFSKIACGPSIHGYSEENKVQCAHHRWFVYIRLVGQ